MHILNQPNTGKAQILNIFSTNYKYKQENLFPPFSFIEKVIKATRILQKRDTWKIVIDMFDPFVPDDM